ncbi:hypothetical protein WS70_05645 [Burkholderia mayonis]|uniref:Uncharacterized protein n=1 Tax=Burkholderia mayonis TaxID=1385591 RepID=A0A1B4FCG6_9BURK|nr:hypothetical protein WS70_05645 [Burkholderia mayonis]
MRRAEAGDAARVRAAKRGNGIGEFGSKQSCATATRGSLGLDRGAWRGRHGCRIDRAAPGCGPRAERRGGSASRCFC